MRAPFVIALLATMLVAAGAPPPRPQTPVTIGGQADLDACPSTAQVTGLNPRGDNFVSVRSRPSEHSRELARLRAGMTVWACSENANGSWTGVIFSPLGETLECGVGTPVARNQAYRGPCASGWVSSRYLTIVAG